MKKPMRRFWKILKWLGISIGGIVLLLILLVLIACLTARLWQTPWTHPLPNISLAPKLPVISESDVKPDSDYAQLRHAIGMAVSGNDLLGDSKERAEAIIDASHDTGEINDPLAAALHQIVDEIAKKADGSASVDWNAEVSWFYDIETQRLNFTRYSDNQFPLTTFLLIKNRTALATILKIAEPLREPKFGIALSDVSHIDLWNFTHLFSTVDLIKISAMREATIGDSVGAFNQLNAALKMARTLTAGRAVIGKLVEYSATKRVLLTLRETAELYDVSPSLLQDETSWLAKWQAKQPYDVVEGLKAESRFSKNFIRKGFNDPITTAKTILFLEKPSKSFSAIVWLTMRANWLMGYSEQTMISDSEFEIKSLIGLVQHPYQLQELKKWKAQWHDDGFAILKKRDPLGYWMTRLSAMTISGVYYRELQNRFEINATRVMLAIRAYKQTEGKLPPSLDALMPKYLPSIPRDPFLENAPLRYRANADGTWIVYSVGADQIDDGGKEPNYLKEPKYRLSLTAKGDLVLHSDEAARSKAFYNRLYR